MGDIEMPSTSIEVETEVCIDSVPTDIVDVAPL